MGDTEDGLKSKKIVFVTVGTTCFDALVRAMDTQAAKQELFRRGYTHLLIQMGRGSYFPTKVFFLVGFAIHSVYMMFLQGQIGDLNSCIAVVLNFN